METRENPGIVLARDLALARLSLLDEALRRDQVRREAVVKALQEDSREAAAHAGKGE